MMRRKMVERDRNKNLNVRCTDAEIEMAKALSEHDGLSVSDVVRQLIRRAHVAAFGPAKPSNKKR